MMIQDIFALVRRVAGPAAAGLVIGVAACSDNAATQPQLAKRTVEEAVASAYAAASALPNSFVAQGLLRAEPLAEDVVVSQVISDDGGTIEVSDADFQLKIPRGAFFGRSMTFTVRALKGSTVAYEFEPHGAVFFAPLTFVQHLSHTNLKSVKPPNGFVQVLNGAYFTSSSLVDRNNGISVVTEFLSTKATWTSNEISFPIWHFSGYMVSTGRM